MKLKTLAAGVVMTLALGGGAQAATLFEEDFSDEATTFGSVLNFTNFDQFTVSAGTVDLILNGGFGIGCQTVGCVDLDGSSSNSGFVSSTLLNFVAGVQYVFSATMSDSQRRTNDTVDFGITNGVLGQTESFTAGSGYTTFTIPFTVSANTTGSVFFQDQGNDNIGVVLDRVSVTSSMAAVPLPATLPLLLAGLGFLGLRRRKAALRA